MSITSIVLLSIWVPFSVLSQTHDRVSWIKQDRLGALPLRMATFTVNASPPIGSPVAYTDARSIEDELSARGILLLPTGEKPIVLCAVDAIGIGNSGLDRWREALAEAAGTSIERVTVHALHQHDCPRYDFATEEIMVEQGCGGKYHDAAFGEAVIQRAAEAVRQASQNTEVVTHVGFGKAKVEKVASNRRVVTEGKIQMRGSSCKDPALIAAPEGVIDPWLRMVTFWNGDQPLTSLMYYATHPMSYYRTGDVSPDFVGLARDQRQSETGVPHIYFTGAGGNIAAGKYNDGSHEMRAVLTGRMAVAMQQAWENQKKRPISGSDLEWRTQKILLPLADHMHEDEITATMEGRDHDDIYKMFDAAKLAWLHRCKAGKRVTLSGLRLGDDIYILHMPGELFVEYQLAAQAMRPDDAVCMAAYGQYGPWYIGTKEAYDQGGYEVGEYSSLVAPEAGEIVLGAIRKLLK